MLLQASHTWQKAKSINQPYDSISLVKPLFLLVQGLTKYRKKYTRAYAEINLLLKTRKAKQSCLSHQTFQETLRAWPHHVRSEKISENNGVIQKSCYYCFFKPVAPTSSTLKITFPDLNTQGE